MTGNWYALQIDSQADAELRRASPTARIHRAFGGKDVELPRLRRRPLLATLAEAGSATRVLRSTEGKLVLPGYVFVQPDTEDDPIEEHFRRWRLVPGVIRVLTGPITDEAIERAHIASESAVSAAFDVAGFEIGDQVEILAGPARGLTGVLLRKPHQRGYGRWYLSVRIAGKVWAMETTDENRRKFAQKANRAGVA